MDATENKETKEQPAKRSWERNEEQGYWTVYFVVFIVMFYFIDSDRFIGLFIQVYLF